MTCSSFRLSSCTYSYMTITGQGLSKRYCGTKSTFTEVSGNDQMAVRFFSRTRTNLGFSCTVSCSGTAPNTTTTTTANTTMTVQCRCGRRNPVTRIVGGVPTTMHEYPWQVALTSTTGTRPFCGGSIISDQYILTAAHCVSGSQPSSVIVVIGEHIWDTTTETNVTQRRAASQIMVHSGYNRNTQDNDIALIKLTSPITFPADNKIAPVCLPPAGNLYDSVTATVTGWGTTTSGLCVSNKSLHVTDTCKEQSGSLLI
ncbi:venom serine protease 34-like [Macrobrachium nipponense]|uniref:venom serine protease 34-like n=1 Tax=Macrobrachium nipponense TaxID=159736 RepID=UPI0030C7C991